MGSTPSVKILGMAMGSALALTTVSIHASGFAIIENSASGMGVAFAGGAAIADDASTIYFNPAGMTRLSGSQAVFAGHIVAPSAEYNDRGSYVNPVLTGGTPVPGSLPGKTSDDGGSTKFVPNFYFSHQVNDKLFAGLGVNAPFGLATKYDNDWIGRFHALESEVKTININPSLAYQVNDRISIGGGISAQYIEATLSNAIDLGTSCFGMEARGILPAGTCSSFGIAPLATEGKVKMNATDWSWGFNLGALFDITENTRLGLSYRSKIEQTAEGRAKFTVPDNFQALMSCCLPLFTDTGIQAAVDLPESAAISLFHQINPQWAIMGDITWTKWDRFDALVIEFDNPAQPDFVQPENWENSMRYALGLNYRHNDKWIFRAGAAYDESPISGTADRTPRIPGNDRTWLSLGLGYQMSETIGFDLGYAHLFIDDTNMNATDVSTGHQLVGEYEADVNILSAQLNVKF